MKLSHFFSTALICIFLMSICCSCGKEQVSPNRAHLSICVFGNSYSNDAFSYVPFLLKEYHITCDIHIFYRSGCSLVDLYDDWERGARTHYYIDTRVDNKWKRGEDLSPSALLALKKWDIVSLQQYSVQVCSKESYYPILPIIIEKVRSSCEYDFDLTWFMAINRNNNRDYDGNLNTQREIIEEHSFDLVLPVAPAIFNCQHHPSLEMVGEGPDGRLYCADGVHLQEGLPCYIAALAVTQALLDRFVSGCTVIGNTLRPTQSWIKSVNGLTQNGVSVGVTDENCLLAQKAAVLANNYKYAIVPIE